MRRVSAILVLSSMQSKVVQKMTQLIREEKQAQLNAMSLDDPNILTVSQELDKLVAEEMKARWAEFQEAKAS